MKCALLAHAPKPGLMSMYFSTLPEVLGNDGVKVLTVPVSETEKIAGSPGFVTVYCVYNSRWVSTATPIGVFTETKVEEAGIATPELNETRRLCHRASAACAYHWYVFRAAR